MTELIKQEIQNHGGKAEIVPIKRLDDLKQDIEDIKSTGYLNNFQQFIVNELYSLEIPEVGFIPRSIIIVAASSPALATITFNYKGKRIPLTLPASYIDKDITQKSFERYLNDTLSPEGYHAVFAPKLPRKLLAVRSGLGRYGRNNICFVEGMGSYLNLQLYFSDIPCKEDNWHEITQMELCKSCKACLNNCPTAAIKADSFLMDNERCLTYFNEGGSEYDFPDWIDKSAHNCIYGCYRCQTVCPQNKAYKDNIIAPVEFTEEETLTLFEGKPFEHFTEQLSQKVNILNMQEYLCALPRNLRPLFDRVK